MNCPKCGSHTVVIDSRYIENNRVRRRECIKCIHRFTTIEIPKNTLIEMKKLVKQSEKLIETVIHF